MGTGGGRSEWCNRLLEVAETDGAGFLLAGEASERKRGLVEHRGDVVRWGDQERRRMRRAIALIFLCTTLLTLGAGAVWAATLIACPNVAVGPRRTYPARGRKTLSPRPGTALCLASSRV